MSISKVVDIVRDNNLVAINEISLPKVPIAQKNWETLSTTTTAYEFPPIEPINGLDADTVNLANIQNNGPQTAGVNWLLPLVILGGFFAASRFKKKKPTAKKVKL